MSTVILAVSLFALSVLALIVQKGEFLSPSFIFPAVFFVAVVNGLTNYSKWSFELSWTTTAVIAGGSFLFVLSGLVVRYLLRGKRVESDGQNTLASIDLPAWCYIGYIALQLVVFGATVYCVISAAKSKGIDGSILEIINKYADKSKHSDMGLRVPLLINLMNSLCQALGMVLAFILANNYAARKCFLPADALPAVALIAMIVGSMAEGSRGIAMMQVIVLVVLIVLMQQVANCGKMKFDKHLIILGCSALACCAVLFFGITLVRGTTYSMYYNLSIYLGAPIKNLDLYLSTQWQAPAVFGANVLYAFYGSLRKVFPGLIPTYVLDNPYHSVNKLPLGNVHTTFYAFIHDFHFIGVVVCTVIMAVCLQVLYEMCFTKHGKTIVSRLLIITYGYLSYTVLFSFFSNKFYETVLRIGFLEFLVIWLVALWGIDRLQSKCKRAGVVMNDEGKE